LALAMIATLVMDLALAAMPGHFPAWSAAALLGMALGQVIIAAAWMALGTSYWLARSMALPFAAIALAQLAAPKVHPSAIEMTGVLLCVGASVAFLLAGARIAGFQLTVGTAESSQLAFQRYSLSNLFALTTVVAVYAAIGREVSFPKEQPFAAALSCAGFVAVAVFTLAILATGMRNDWRILLVAVLIGAAWGALPGPMGRVAAIEAAFLWAALHLLLDCKCRISWQADTLLESH
jgi:hypothetical protein